MAFSQVGICNMALGHIGSAKRIQTTAENSNEGRAAALWYEPCRLITLEAANWNFARKRAALSLSSEDPPDEWGYRYQYPAGIVAFRYLVNPLGRKAPAVPFHIELNEAGDARTILTDLEDAYGIMTQDVQDPTIFSGNFVQALSHLIASNLGPNLVSDKNMQRDQLQKYDAWIRQANALNANEQMEDEPRDAPWISGR